MTFSNANIITPKTRRILEATNAMLKESETTVVEEVPKNVVEVSPDKILLKEATESGTFSYQGFGIYKEADTVDSIGRVWIKKEVIDEVTGEKQEWLVAYTNEEEDFARSLATKKLNAKKVIAGKGAQDLINEVEAGGEKINTYTVDTSPAVLYAYKGNRYEIITWNDATEHISGEKQISNFRALQKQSYDEFGIEELQRGQSEIDNKIKDLDMPELEESTRNPFNIPTSDAEVFDGSGTVIQMGSIVQNEFGKKGKVADILSPTKVTVSWFGRTYTEGERGDTIYPGDIKVTGRMEKVYSDNQSISPNVREFEMSASNEKGDYCVVSKNVDKFSGECGSITSAESFNDPELHDTVEFDTVENATRWFDTKIAELGLATDKFHERANSYDIAQEFAQILSSNGETQHTLSKVAGRGIYAMHPATMRDYKEPPLPEINIDDLVVDTRTDKSGFVKQINGDVVDILIEGSYMIPVPIENIKKLTTSEKKAYDETSFPKPPDARKYKPDYGVSGKIMWSKEFIIPQGKELYGTDKFVAYIEKLEVGDGGIEYGAVIDEVNGQTVSGDTFHDENEARKFLAAEVAAIKDNAKWWNTEAHVSESLKQLHKTAGQPKPEDIPIAPGIKSKNITLDESGGQGSAKVTIDFTNVDQGLKFYQEQVTEAPPVAPKEEPAVTPAVTPAAPVAPKEVPQGPPIPISSSLKFAYDEVGSEGLQVGSPKWTKNKVEAADDYFAQKRILPDAIHYITYIRKAAEKETGHCEEDTAKEYWKNYQATIGTDNE